MAGEANDIPMDHLALMGVRSDTLFVYDGRGRMLSSNEPREQERRPAPRLFLGCTVAGHAVRFGARMPDGVARRLEAIIKRQPTAAELRVPASLVEALRDALTEHAPITAEGGGPAYRFPEPLPPPGEAVPLTDANRHLVCETYPWLYDEIADWQPCAAVVRDGAAVSVCFSARSGAAAAEAGVETLPDFRGRGYATAVTAAWGAAIQQSGRIPLYSTAWDNLASQAVARHVGLTMFGADLTLS
jgi:hypothetical protein